MSLKEQIHTKLCEAFSPEICEVLNESASHNVPKDSETHFKALIVSKQFQGLSLLQRQRTVHTHLKLEILAVHAFSFEAWTPEEWETHKYSRHPSPPCQGSKTLPMSQGK